MQLPPRTTPALVQALARRAGPRVAAAFAEAGLDGVTPAQAVALVPLVESPRHASDLAEINGVSRQAVAQALTALEKGGYVRRITDPDDARAKLIELTERGWLALRTMRRTALEVEREWEATLGAEDAATFRALLSRLLDTST
ncbi:MarR family winged helix-turn-helix transcriptional regulator [Gordonia sp. ABSL49_1]|uniref:MarR family winged helix-turn-helix transcriptional regulator n=1 Tax=unclassified Gordonia (in: high G+C Gram-positive bacteria) TaxID=2657482 RepID=UPI001F0F480D|nr:MarR family transcriptional regulator [Gordonia sp. ABSL49_1]MCH5644778.1 MarR family transcriptional regulator [Gordonia sp. ABSL49_1]